MIAKTNCLNCGNGIEFDPAQLGGEKFLVINCPHCGKETVLTLQKDESPKVIYVQPPPQPQRKSHGVFYYVFWGVVSLFATFFILGVLFWILVGVGFVAIPAFMEGRNAGIAAKQDKENGITNSVETTTVTANDLEKQKMDYINTSLTLYGFMAKYIDFELDGKIPGVDFKIKNIGDKTLKEVDVTVYFKDSFGRTISEKKFYPVLVTKFGTGNEPLKPGYIWQQEQGKFYETKNVPSEWKEGNVEAKITDIEFSDSEK
jgi:hypothetical protein